tara:strand:- start:708 stop:1187 length:480 start_codon:yes stop_codon:yes gene_type:complete
MDVLPLPLVYAPEQVLLTKCQPVHDVTEELQQFARQMVLTMYQHKGIGLAAPQVDRSIRLIVVDCSTERNAPMVAFNPTILWRQGHLEFEEGCLSFPGEHHTVRRAARIGLAFLGLDGKHHQGTAEGIWAVCVQHEIDHLDGITFDVRARAAARPSGAA